MTHCISIRDRVIVNGSIPRKSDRTAICNWAKNAFPKLIRSKYGVVRWGRGGCQRSIPNTGWFPRGWYCKDAGVRLEQGNLLVFEDYLEREVGRFPLADVALEIVKAMNLFNPEVWNIKGWVDLQIYCDHLEENNEQRIVRILRRWAEEIRNPAPTDPTARKRSYRRPRFLWRISKSK